MMKPNRSCADGPGYLGRTIIVTHRATFLGERRSYVAWAGDILANAYTSDNNVRWYRGYGPEYWRLVGDYPE